MANMGEGGCLCGNIRISYTGEPVIQSLCHCADCRKISGSAFSLNAVIPISNFTLIRGNPQIYEKKGGESGLPIRSFFCQDCGTTCFRQGDAFPGLVIIKAGTLDQIDLMPSLESYADARLHWITAVEGARQRLSPINAITASSN